MRISGNNRADFRTINRFRSTVMKGSIEDLFAAMIEMLIEEGYVNLEKRILGHCLLHKNWGVSSLS